MINITLALLVSLQLIGKDKPVETYSIANENNQFSFELYQKLNKEDKNLFFSPYSISTALGMTYSGARNSTAKEMASVMHFNTNIEQSNKAFKGLITAINSRNNEDIKMSVANRLFGDKRFDFNLDFLNTVNENFGAPLEKMDYKNDLEGSRKKINKWVEDQTNNKIKELIKKDVLPDSTKLVLVNAIYFYGDWLNQFDSSLTYVKPFYLDEKNTIDHKLMFQKTSVEYFAESDFQAIRMPYKGNKIYMEIYLPNQKDGLKNLENKLITENYLKWSSKFTYTKVYLTIPKFKMTADFSLGNILQEMGMKTAFSDAADFLNMVNKPKDALKISKVIHKAFIDVSEKGTEAAAATAVIMVAVATSAGPNFEEVKTFYADHPFFFMIKDRETGSILFMGKIVNPAKED